MKDNTLPFEPIELGTDEDQLKEMLAKRSQYVSKAERVRELYQELFRENIDFARINKFLNPYAAHGLRVQITHDYVELVSRYLCQKHQLTLPSATNVNYRELVKLLNIKPGLIEAFVAAMLEASSGLEDGTYEQQYYSAEGNVFRLPEEQEEEIRKACVLRTRNREENEIYAGAMQVIGGLNALAGHGLGMSPYIPVPDLFRDMFTRHTVKTGRYSEVIGFGFNPYYFRGRERAHNRMEALTASGKA